MNSICINKSGSKFPVRKTTDRDSEIIGYIYNREAFGYDSDWGGDQVFCHIIFMNSSNQLQYGFLIDPPYSVITPCTDYPYEESVQVGTEGRYMSFMLRKASKLYDANGNYKETIPAGRRVFCQSKQAGKVNPELKCINYFDNGYGGFRNAGEIGDSGKPVGFVDALSQGTGYSTIAMYGSW